MTTYVVKRKSDGLAVYAYTADVPVEVAGFEFATHDHEAQSDVAPPDSPAPEPQVLARIEFMRRLTPAERIAIRSLAKADPIAEDFMDLLNVTNDIRTDDPDVAAGLGYLTLAGILAAGRLQEILNG